MLTFFPLLPNSSSLSFGNVNIYILWLYGVENLSVPLTET